MNGEENMRNIESDMAALKVDGDFIYMDEAFAEYIIEQTNHIKRKVVQIEHLVVGFQKKTAEIPAGLVPSHNLIDEFSKAVNYLEKAHTGLSIELIRLKSMQMMQEHMVQRTEQPAEEKPPTDVSFQ